MEFEYFGSIRKLQVFNMWIKLVVFSTKNWSVFATNWMNASAAMLSMMIPIISGFISGLDIRTSTTSQKLLGKRFAKRYFFRK